MGQAQPNSWKHFLFQTLNGYVQLLPLVLLHYSGDFPAQHGLMLQRFQWMGTDDFEGLDASAAHIANLLSTEPADVKLGVGGFSMGAATRSLLGYLLCSWQVRKWKPLPNQPEGSCWP
ncbi:hypothetical protein Ancab_029400 [Ancistrocladus abbreviatus]